MKKKTKRKKYAVGTKVNNYIETPNQALAEHNLNLDKSFIEAESNPVLGVLEMLGKASMGVGTNMLLSSLGGVPEQDLGMLSKGKSDMQSNFKLPNLMKSLENNPVLYAALGGKVPGVPVEIEGDEVGEMPNGKVFESKGPSHEQGGIDITLPEGTEMYSKRIKVDGVSMADRKKKRKKKEVTLEELMAKDKSDVLLKNSLSRTKSNNAKIDEADKKIQETVKSILEPQPTAEHKWGDIVKNLVGNAPDILGYIGTGISTFGPMQNTKNMRSGDTPNINPFENFGDDALKTNEDMMSLLGTQKDEANQQISRSSASNTRKGRNSARGVNQMRAMDLANSMQDKIAKSGVETNYAQQLMQLFGQKSQLENQQDQMQMKGEGIRDANDRADRDAFFSQLSKDISNKGAGLQSFAKSLNKQGTNKETLAMIEKMKQSGINTATIQAMLEAFGSVPYVNPKMTKKK